MSPFGLPQPQMPDEMEPQGFEHGPLGEAGEMPHQGEVIPLEQYMPQPLMVPEHVVKLQKQMLVLTKLAQMQNAAEVALDEEQRNKLGAAVVREFKIDDESRADWKQMATRAMAMAKQKRESKSTPWEGASNVKYPLLTTAALQFAARAYPAIVDGPRVVKCTVLGRDEQGLKAAMANRVSQHMSYQLLYEMPAWESDMDTCLHQIPIIGCAFKKIYADPTSDAGVGDDLVSAFDFVVHQNTKNLRSVPRSTHVFKLYPHEIEERKRDGRFLDLDFTTGGEDGNDEDSPHEFLEQHRYWDIDGDGIKEPWIVTVHKETERVVRLRACFDPTKIVADQAKGKIIKIERRNYWVKIPFLPDPEGGFYDVGFGKLLEAISDVVDTTINQMMDAATLQNSGGGFIADGLQLGKSKVKLKLGEYQRVQASGNEIRNAIYNHEHKGPAPVLFQLLELMVNSGKDIAGVKDILTGETPTNQTATSTMAAIEQGLKVFTAIYKRIFRALKEEYRLIFEINKETLNQPKYVALLGDPIEVVSADYHDDLTVVPVSDPNSVTDMQRMAKAQFAIEMVKEGNPNINAFEATKRALEAARIEDPQKLLVQPNPEPPPQAKAELAKMAADVDLTRAQTIKTVADATVGLAQVGLSPAVPMAVYDPQIIVSGEQGQQPPPMPGPMPPDMGPMPGLDGMGGPPQMQPDAPGQVDALMQQLQGQPPQVPEPPGFVHQ